MSFTKLSKCIVTVIIAIKCHLVLLKTSFGASKYVMAAQCQTILIIDFLLILTHFPRELANVNICKPMNDPYI